MGFVVQLTMNGINSYGFSVFMKPMSHDLGFSRAEFAGVQSFGTFVSGFIAPFIGPIIDKRGGRDLMIVGAIIAGIGYVSLSFVQGVVDFYILRGVIVTIGVAFISLLSVSVAVSNWFVRLRGRAMSTMVMGSAFAGVVMTPVTTILIQTFGWRVAWVILGIVVWVFLIPLVALLMKRRPEDHGLLPDGDSPETVVQAVASKGGVSRSAAAEETWTRAEAVRTSTIWLTILAFGLGSMGVGTVVMHLYSYLTDIGMGAARASAGVMVTTFASAVFKPIWGILMDRYHVRYCAMVAFIFAAISTAILSVLFLYPSNWLVFLVAAIAGFSMGGQLPIQEVIWANYFGRLSLGAVRSVASPFAMIFSAGGPFFAGWAFDTFGNYRIAFTIFTFTYIVAVTIVFFTPTPRKAPKHEQV